MPRIPTKCLSLFNIWFLTPCGGKRAHLLSETSAVDLGDGVRSHGAPNARAGRRTLGYRCDAVGRVLTGWGKGRITGHTQTIVCGTNSRPEITIRKCIMETKNMGKTELFSLLNNELTPPSWEAGSRGRSSVKCRHSSPCSSWPEDSCSTLDFPFFPSRSFKIIYRNTKHKHNINNNSTWQVQRSPFLLPISM